MTPESVQAGGPQLDFILNLHDILNEPSSNAAMHWSRDGRSFSLAEESEFPDHLLSRLSVVSYSSLIRRLYYYGFHKSGDHTIMSASYEDSLAPYAPAGRRVMIICPRPTAHVGHVSNISEDVDSERRLMFGLF